MADDEKPPVRVQIVDIDIPFLSLAWLVAKLIPAVILGAAVVGLIGGAIYAVLHTLMVSASAS